MTLSVCKRLPLDEGERYILEAKDMPDVEPPTPFKGIIVTGECNGSVEELYLFEWVSYKVYGKIPSGVKKVELVLGSERLSNVLTVRGGGEETRLFDTEFSLGNRVGLLKLSILEDGYPIKLRVRHVSIISAKILEVLGIREVTEDALRRHDEFVSTLTSELAARALELPFTIEAPSSFRAVEVSRKPSTLFAYHYLRNNYSRILTAYEAILRRPKRTLTIKREWVNYWEADTVDENLIINILTHPEHLTRTDRGGVAILKDSKGRGYAPLKLNHVRKRITYDTPENRFAKKLLKELLTLSSTILRELKGIPREEEAKIRDLHARLTLTSTSPVIQEAKDTASAPHVTQAMLKQEGYREALQLWISLKSRVPFLENLTEAIDSKDIAKLYEYWCLFKLIDELQEALGKAKLKLTISPTGEIPENGEGIPKYQNDGKLHYNKPIKGYSVKLRPDYTLYKGNQLIGVLDAKFKLQTITGHETELPTEEENQPTPETWAKLEDIYKMHTYRDALKAKFAIILYPGNRNIYFTEDGRKAPLKSLTELLRLASSTPGVGYLSMRPVESELRVSM